MILSQEQCGGEDVRKDVSPPPSCSLSSAHSAFEQGMAQEEEIHRMLLPSYCPFRCSEL